MFVSKGIILIKLNYLKLVKIVAEEGSLSKAGNRLFLSQPALSHQLKELESFCNGQVFNRIGKRMILTELGEKVLSAADIVLTELDNLELELKNYTENNFVKLTMCSSCYTGYYWFPPIVKEFYKFFPNSEISISNEANDDPITQILNAKIDLAVVSQKMQNKNLVFTEAFKDQIFTLVPHGHKWQSRKYVEIKEFADEEVIIYPKPITAFQKLLKSEKVIPKKIIKLQLTEARIEMVKAGLGVSVLAGWAIKPYLDREEVVPVKITPKGLHRTWHIVCLKNQANTKHMKKLVQITKKKLREL